MKVKELKSVGNEQRYLIKETTVEFMNALRRIMTGSVPTFAISEVTIYENNSYMFDEYLGHRLGLIPLTTDLKTYKVGETTKLMLEKNGPGMVYSGDIKSTDAKVKVVNKNIPLVELKKDQNLKIEATAELAGGKKHVKHAPGVIAYYPLPELHTLEDHSPELEKAVKACPVNVLETKKGKIEFTDPYGCILCRACVDAAPNGMDLTLSANEFVLVLENFGQLENQEVLLKASEIIRERAEELEKLLKKI